MLLSPVELKNSIMMALDSLRAGRQGQSEAGAGFGPSRVRLRSRPSLPASLLVRSVVRLLAGAASLACPAWAVGSNNHLMGGVLALQLVLGAIVPSAPIQRPLRLLSLDLAQVWPQ